MIKKINLKIVKNDLKKDDMIAISEMCGFGDSITYCLKLCNVSFKSNADFKRYCPFTSSTCTSH